MLADGQAVDKVHATMSLTSTGSQWTSRRRSVFRRSAQGHDFHRHLCVVHPSRTRTISGRIPTRSTRSQSCTRQVSARQGISDFASDQSVIDAHRSEYGTDLAPREAFQRLQHHHGRSVRPIAGQSGLRRGRRRRKVTRPVSLVDSRRPRRFGGASLLLGHVGSCVARRESRSHLSGEGRATCFGSCQRAQSLQRLSSVALLRRQRRALSSPSGTDWEAWVFRSRRSPRLLFHQAATTSAATHGGHRTRAAWRRDLRLESDLRSARASVHAARASRPASSP